MARSSYQYGTSPKKVDIDYKRKETRRKPLKIVEDLPRQQIKVSKEQRKKHLKMSTLVAAIFLLLLTISCRNSQIDNQFTQIQEQKKQLAALQKENEQLKVNIENSLNLNNIEKIAKEELGMQKLNSKQTIYVTLPKKDYVESASEKVVMDGQKNWFEQIFEKVFK